MKSIFSRSGVIVLIIFGVVLSGCITTNPSQPAKFYLLSPMSESKKAPQVEAGEGCFAIGVGPVQIPEYLNRPQIVSRKSTIELFLDEFNKWAEPLEDNFTRVLAENLANILRTDPVAIFPSRGSIPVDYRVTVDVIRFDGMLGKDITLIARWAIFGKEREELLSIRRSVYTEPAGENTYKILVLAKSRAIEKLSKDIAAAIKELISGKAKS
jgi:uncharacterized lipoprotein YmbA